MGKDFNYVREKRTKMKRMMADMLDLLEHNFKEKGHLFRALPVHSYRTI